MTTNGRMRELTPKEKGWMLDALKKTRPRQYDVIERHLAGQSQAEIAEALGITQGSVSRRLATGRASLEKLKARYLQQHSKQA
jgi:RNA polymerase sigma factor (sigma-70 family)